MTSPSKSRVQRQRDHFDRQFDRSSPPKIDFDHDTDLFPPVTSRYLRDRNNSASGSGSISSTSTGTPERERGNPIANNSATYPNYYDYSENGPPLNIQTQQQKQQEANDAAAMANMAMQVPLQQQQAGRLVDNSRAQPPVTTAQMAAAARIAAANGGGGGGGGGGGPGGGGGGGGGRNARPPSYAGSTHNQRSPEEPIFPPNKVDLDAARYRQTQQRRPQGNKDGRPSTNGSGTGGGGGGRPQSSGIGPGAGNPNVGNNNNNNHNHNNNNSPGSDNTPPMLSPGAAAHIQRLPTPSLATSVLQPLDAKVVEYGTLLTEAQGDMARLDDEMRQLQERQREAEGRFLEAKARHDEYRRQYQDVERALKGDFVNGGMAGNGGGGSGGGMMGPGMRGGPGGAPPVPPVPHMGERSMTDRGGGPGPGGQHRPAMASQRTVSAHSDQPSMMSQDSVRTQKKGRFSRIFGV